MILDAGLWTTFSYTGSIVALALLWLKTGKSPFIWGMWLMSHCEATRRQLWLSTAEFVRHFRGGYREREREVRTEVASQ